MGVETVQKGAQHAALWGTGAQCPCGGEVGAESHSLGPVGEEVFYPGAYERGEAKGDECGDENVRNYCIEG